MPTYRLAAGACAIALLVAGCSSSSNGNGKASSIVAERERFDINRIRSLEGCELAS